MSGLSRALEAIQQKSDDVFAFEINGIEIVFRLPPVALAQQYSILLNMTQTESERTVIYETIFRNVVQDDWMINEAGGLQAGVPETVSKLVFMFSGLDDTAKQYTEELLQLYRTQSSSILMTIKRTICSVFPSYTFESLGQLNYQNLINVFVQAEKILLEKGIIESEFEFMSPDQAKEANFKVENLIKQDKEAYREYDDASKEDPRKLAHMAKLREAAKKRAEMEEKEFKKRYMKTQPS